MLGHYSSFTLIEVVNFFQSCSSFFVVGSSVIVDLILLKKAVKGTGLGVELLVTRAVRNMDTWKILRECWGRSCNWWLPIQLSALETTRKRDSLEMALIKSQNII